MFGRPVWTGAIGEQCLLENSPCFLHREGMTSDDLKQLLRGAAFRPFTVYAEGKSFRISHPEFAALTLPGKTLVVFHKNDNGFDLIDVDLIARVDVHDPHRKRTAR